MLLWEFGELRVQRHINYMIHERLWSGSEHKVTHVLATSCPIYNLCRYCKCPILGMCNIPRYSPLLQVTQSTLDLSFQHQKMVLLNPARHYSVSWYVVRGQLFSSLSLPPAWYLVDIETVGAASNIYSLSILIKIYRVGSVLLSLFLASFFHLVFSGPSS